MFRRLIRVILTADINRFERGMGRARTLFQRFVGAIPSGVSVASLALQGLQSGITLLTNAFNSVRDAASRFLDGVIGLERAQVILRNITGDADVTAQIMADLSTKATQYGLSLEDALPATTQLAQGLRAIDGSVDPEKLSRVADLLFAFSKARPEVPIDRAARALANALAGDFTSFQQVFDVNPDIIQGLSDNARKLLEAGTSAQEEALGAVTRLGGDATAAGGDAVAAIEEILNAVGISQGMLDDLADTTEGKLNRVEAYWEQFKRDIADDVLPVINEQLDKLLAFLEENPELVQELADALGNLTVTAIEEIIELLAGDSTATAVERVGQLVDFIERLAAAIESISELQINLPSGLVGQAFGDPTGGRSTGQIVQEQGGLGLTQGGILDPNSERNIQLFDALNNAAEGLNNFGSNSGLFATLDRLAQGIPILVSVDDELKLRAAVQSEARREANQAVGNLVDSTTGTGQGRVD